MTSKLNHDAPHFNFRYTPQWRSVDQRATLLIAKRCSGGVDFAGCSKSHVIECMARKQSGYTTNPSKFVYLMDAAARVIPRLKATYDAELGRKLSELDSKFEADKPPANK